MGQSTGFQEAVAVMAGYGYHRSVDARDLRLTIYDLPRSGVDNCTGRQTAHREIGVFRVATQEQGKHDSVNPQAIPKWSHTLLQPVRFMAARTATEPIADRLILGDNSNMARRRAKFYEVLRQQQEKERLVCVYHGDDGHDKFDVGFIESLTPTMLTLLSVSPRGEFDGRVVMHLDDLNRIEMEDRYSRKIQLLHQYRGSIFKTDDHVNPQARTDDLHAQLLRAAEEHQVACVEDIKGNAVTGFIAEVGDDFVVVEALTQLGEPDGQAVINLEEVTRVQLGARDQQIRGFLYRYDHELRKLLEY